MLRAQRISNSQQPAEENYSSDLEKQTHRIEISRDELKAKLHAAIEKLLKAYTSWSDNIDENMIFVSIKKTNDKTTTKGSVLCPLCERNDVKKISVFIAVALGMHAIGCKQHNRRCD